MADHGFLPFKKRKAMSLAIEAVDHKAVVEEMGSKFIINAFQTSYRASSSDFTTLEPTSASSEVRPLQKMRKINSDMFIVDPSSISSTSSGAMQTETHKVDGFSLPNHKRFMDNSQEIPSHVIDESSNETTRINQQKLEESIKRSELYNQPYKKFPSRTEKGWLEKSWRLGVSRPTLYTTKRVTTTDTVPNQNRFQLTESETANSMHKLKRRSNKLAEMKSEEGLPVKVMDRMGNLYNMSFKYLQSSKTYRFMGTGYKEFLKRTELTPNQIMDVWGLPGLEGGYEDYRCFALINSEEEKYETMEADGEEERGGGNQRREVQPLAPLPHWLVKV